MQNHQHNDIVGGFHQATRQHRKLTVLAWLLTLTACTAAVAAMRPHNLRNDEKSPNSGLFLVVGAAAKPQNTALATFAAGCFWGVEDHFRKLPGVVATAVGYTGGTVPEPSYEQVCDHGTGHAEAVQIEFDPKVVSYDKLVEEFLWIHDPTTLNRQGPDVGDQYRSAIFFHDAAQGQAAKKAIATLSKSGELDGPVVTQVVKAPKFWFAEGYHQQWIEKGGRGGCHKRQRKH